MSHYTANPDRSRLMGSIIFLTTTIIIIVFIIGAVLLWPQFNVYAKRMAGQAAFQQAESDRQIAVLEAQAALDSADLTSQAEVRRATGVAEANKIIANSLGGPEGYLRWRYIEMLEASTKSTGTRDIIYVPTEAGLPILEAGRVTRPIQQEAPKQ